MSQRRWTWAEWETVREMYASGRTANEIAVRLGRTARSVQQYIWRWQGLGMFPVKRGESK